MPVCTISSIFLQPPLLSSIKASFYYKYYLDSSWILIQSNVTINPPLVQGSIDCPVVASPAVSFTIPFNLRYSVRVINEQCEVVYEEDIFVPCEQGCPDGYTLAPDGTYCYKITTQPAVVVDGGTKYVEHFSRSEYGIFGVVFYKLGNFNINGTWNTSGDLPNLYNNSNLQSPPPNNINFNTLLSSPFLNVPEDTSHGRLNLSGVWLQGNSSFVGTLGFARQIYLPEEKVCYVSVGADNYCTIKINGVVIVSQSPSLTGAINYFNNSLQNQLFRYWHCYPVLLPSGYSLIEVETVNTGSVGVLGLEIYNGTEAELVACTNESELDNYIVFSTKNIPNGAAFDVGNYTCSDYPGYSLVMQGSPAQYVCQLINKKPTNC